MTKIKKNYINLSASELATEAKKISEQIAKVHLDLMTGKAKNTRQVFNLRKQLAVVKSYLNSKK